MSHKLFRTKTHSVARRKTQDKRQDATNFNYFVGARYANSIRKKAQHGEWHLQYLLDTPSLEYSSGSNKRWVNTVKFKINAAATGIYLRSGVYWNFYVNNSNRKLVIGLLYKATLKRFKNHYSTSVQFIALIPTKESWRNVHVLYMLLSSQFSRLVLNFIDYRKKSLTFYSCFTYVVLYYPVILANLKHLITRTLSKLFSVFPKSKITHKMIKRANIS